MSGGSGVLWRCCLAAMMLAACDAVDLTGGDDTDDYDPGVLASEDDYGGTWSLTAPDPADCRDGQYVMLSLTIVAHELDQGFFDNYYAVEGLEHTWRSGLLSGYVKGRLQVGADEWPTYVRLRFYGPMGEPNYLFTFVGDYFGDVHRMRGVLDDNSGAFGTPGCRYLAELEPQ